MKQLPGFRLDRCECLLYISSYISLHALRSHVRSLEVCKEQISRHQYPVAVPNELLLLSISTLAVGIRFTEGSGFNIFVIVECLSPNWLRQLARKSAGYSVHTRIQSNEWNQSPLNTCTVTKT